MDNPAVVAKDKEELETLSADLLARLSVLVLRKSGLTPREVEMALDLECSVAVRLGAKPPITDFGAGATACSNLPTRSVDKQGILTIRPKFTAACNLMMYQSLAPAQPTLPTTLKQAIPSNKNRPYSTVLNSSTRPAENVAAEALEEQGGGGLRLYHY